MIKRISWALTFYDMQYSFFVNSIGIFLFLIGVHHHYGENHLPIGLKINANTTCDANSRVSSTEVVVRNDKRFLLHDRLLKVEKVIDPLINELFYFERRINNGFPIWCPRCDS